MSAVRLDVRNLREILRLRYGVPPLSHRDIGVSCNISPSTVGETLTRFRLSDLGWPLPDDLDDKALEAALYRVESCGSTVARPEPDWATVHRELGGKSMTLALLWEEYSRIPGDTYGYSWFCQAYREFAGRKGLVMRQTHKLGEKVFVDYAGDTVGVINPRTGQVQFAQVFVGVLGASNYTYAEATWGQDIQNWVMSHVRMFAFFGGVPEIAVPDNLKSGVTKPCYYQPKLNPTYHEMAKHYELAVIPARVRKPRDKAKAEQGVLLVQRWVLAALRKRTFYNLEDLNEAIDELIEWLNARPFKKLPGSRRQRFEEDERPCLRALPPEPYVFAQWSKARVALDYHVEVEGHYYSVPYTLVRETVEIRIAGMIVEVLHFGVRVASHRRSFDRFFPTTLPEHMPSHHRHRAEWTPERVSAWAAQSGVSVRLMAEGIMKRREHPEQGFRACLGLMQLGRKYGGPRLQAACGRAVEAQAFSYRSVKSILVTGLDQQPTAPTPTRTAGHHPNVRGGAYYKQLNGTEGE